MIPFLPPQLTFWGSPLYHELYVGLCRALTQTWLGVRPYGGIEPSTPPAPPGKRPARGNWRLIDSRSAGGATIRATSLVDLHATVQDLSGMSDDALRAEDAVPAAALD